MERRKFTREFARIHSVPGRWPIWAASYWTNQRTNACDRRHELATSLARKALYRI
jgi:hypothetical protein